MRFDTRQAFRLVLIGTAALSVAACAGRRPATDPLAGTAPGAGAGAGAGAGVGAPGTAPLGSVGSGVTGAAIPGSAQDFAATAGERVFFDLDQYVIRADGRPVLRAQAEWLARYPNVRVLIEGNADERGTREYNLALGARRAQAVRDYLVSQGVSAQRIETVSYGKERPIDGGSGEESHARNRNARTSLVGAAG